MNRTLKVLLGAATLTLVAAGVSNAQTGTLQGRQMFLYDGGTGPSLNRIGLKSPETDSITANYRLVLPLVKGTADDILQINYAGGDSAQLGFSNGNGLFWRLIGNSTTTPWTGATGNYLGTSDAQDLVIRAGGDNAIQFWNGTGGGSQRMILDANGLLGVGVTPSASYQAEIADATGTYNGLAVTTILANGAALYLSSLNTGGVGAVLDADDVGIIVGNGTAPTNGIEVDATGVGLLINHNGTPPAVGISMYSSPIGLQITNSTTSIDADGDAFLNGDLRVSDDGSGVGSDNSTTVKIRGGSAQGTNNLLVVENNSAYNILNVDENGVGVGRVTVGSDNIDARLLLHNGAPSGVAVIQLENTLITNKQYVIPEIEDIGTFAVAKGQGGNGELLQSQGDNVRSQWVNGTALANEGVSHEIEGGDRRFRLGSTTDGNVQIDATRFVRIGTGSLTFNDGSNELINIANGDVNVNVNGAGTTDIGNTTTGGAVSVSANSDITVDVGATTNDLVLNNIQPLSPVKDLLWITATNEVRRSPFTSSADEGIQFAAGAYRLGDATQNTGNAIISTRYVNVGALGNLVFTNGTADVANISNGGNLDATLGLDVTGADLTVGGTLFTVDDATGNTSTDGDLTVKGSSTLGDADADVNTVRGATSINTTGAATTAIGNPTSGNVDVNAPTVNINTASGTLNNVNIGSTATDDVHITMGDPTSSGDNDLIIVGQGGGTGSNFLMYMTDDMRFIGGDEVTFRPLSGAAVPLPLGNPDNSLHFYVNDGLTHDGTITLGNTGAGGVVSILANSDITINPGAGTGDLVLPNTDVDNTVTSILGLTGANEVRSTNLNNIAWLVGGNTLTAAGEIGTNSAHDVIFETSGTERFRLTAAGALTQVAGGGQVTFTGNVDAKNGLDVTGADLTVGGTLFTVDDATGNTSTDGDLTVKGSSTLGNADADVNTVRGATSINTTGAATTSIGSATSGNVSVNAPTVNINTTAGALNNVNIGGPATDDVHITMGNAASAGDNDLIIVGQAGGTGSNLLAYINDDIRFIGGDEVTFRPLSAAAAPLPLGSPDNSLLFYVNDGPTHDGTITLGNTGAGGVVSILANSDITINPGAGTGDLVLPNTDVDNTVTRILGLTATNEVRSTNLNNVAWLVGGNTLTAAGEIGTNSAHDVIFETNGTERFRLTAAGALTQVAGGGQVTFTGNVDATNGLDVTGADLTVGTNASVDGALNANGNVALGNGLGTDIITITSTGASSDVTITTARDLILNGIDKDNTDDRILTIDATTNIVSYRTASSLVAANQGLEYLSGEVLLGHTTDGSNPITTSRFVTVNTGNSLTFNNAAAGKSLVIDGTTGNLAINTTASDDYELNILRNDLGTNDPAGINLLTTVTGATNAYGVRTRAENDGSTYGLEARAYYTGAASATNSVNGVFAYADNGGVNIAAIGTQSFADHADGGAGINMGVLGYANNATSNVGVLGAVGADDAALAALGATLISASGNAGVLGYSHSSGANDYAVAAYADVANGKAIQAAATGNSGLGINVLANGVGGVGIQVNATATGVLSTGAAVGFSHNGGTTGFQSTGAPISFDGSGDLFIDGNSTLGDAVGDATMVNGMLSVLPGTADGTTATAATPGNPLVAFDASFVSRTVGTVNAAPNNFIQMPTGTTVGQVVYLTLTHLAAANNLRITNAGGGNLGLILTPGQTAVIHAIWDGTNWLVVSATIQ